MRPTNLATSISVFDVHPPKPGVSLVLPERYQVKDSDSALLSFGDGSLVRTPRRFSLGLIESGAHSTVEERVAFIVAAIH
jgi:hypothetical protein